MILRPLLPWLLSAALAAAPPAFVKTGQGPSVLLVHGLGGNHGVWREVAAVLAKDHTVVQVDLPGSSGSEGPALVEGAADFEAIAGDLAALVRREKLEPCLVVGHSMGGPLAALAVLRDPSAFRGLVLVDSFLGTIPAVYFEKTLQALDRDPKAALADFYRPMSAGGAQLDRLVTEALALPGPVLKAYLRGLSRDNLRGRQAGLTLPVVQFEAGPGQPDPARREAYLALAGFKALPDFRIVPFPAAHHWIMWDDPAGFLGALKAFESGRIPARGRGAEAR